MKKVMKIWLVAMVVILLGSWEQIQADLQLLVTSRNTNNVLRYDGVTGIFIDKFVTAGSGGLSSPVGMAIGSDGNLYVTSHNQEGSLVLRYNGQTGSFIDIFCSPIRNTAPYAGLIFGPDENLYAATESYFNAYRFDGQTGAFIDEFLHGGNNIASVGMTFGIDGDFYVSNAKNKSIDRYNGATGMFIDEFVPQASNGGLVNPFGLTFGPDGNLYVCSFFGTGKGIFRYNGVTGEFIDEFVTAGSGGLKAAINLAFGPDGNLYVCSFNTSEVLRYNGQTGDFIDVFASGGGLNRAADLVFVSEPVIPINVDIKPGSCPNPFNVKSKGVLPVAILGTEEFDVSAIDAASIFLNGVPAIRSSYEDVGGPVANPNECECTTDAGDGFGDLVLKFYTQQIVETLGEVNAGDILTLPLTGVLNDETGIEGADCVVIVGRHKPINKADINKDGVVNTVDIAIVAENWLESSIVEE